MTLTARVSRAACSSMVFSSPHFATSSQPTVRSCGDADQNGSHRFLEEALLEEVGEGTDEDDHSSGHHETDVQLFHCTAEASVEPVAAKPRFPNARRTGALDARSAKALCLRSSESKRPRWP